MSQSTRTRRPVNAPVVPGSAAPALPPQTLPMIPEAAIVEALTRKLDAGELEPLPPGEYAVKGQAVIDINCVVSKGQRTEAAQAVRLDPARLMAALLVRAGVSLDRVQDLAHHAALDANAHEVPAAQAAALDLIAATVGRVREQIAAALPKVEREGACRVVGTVTVDTFVRN